MNKPLLLSVTLFSYLICTVQMQAKTEFLTLVCSFTYYTKQWYSLVGGLLLKQQLSLLFIARDNRAVARGLQIRGTDNKGKRRKRKQCHDSKDSRSKKNSFICSTHIFWAAVVYWGPKGEQHRQLLPEGILTLKLVITNVMCVTYRSTGAMET